jgi:AraC-like DNA-binding protein
MPAFLETVIHFDFDDVLTVGSAGGGFEQGRPLGLVGPHTLAGTSLRFAGNIDSFAIFLQPTALWSLFRVPTSVVMETHYDAEDVLGAAIAELWHVLAEMPNFADRVRAAELFLLRSANFEPGATVTTAAASLLVFQGGRIAIDDLASQMNVSVRQLERSFLREIGISPKRFARVARFQAALDARVGRPDRSWLDISIESGYHDQMHLVHEFQSLCGLSPTLTVELLGDSRPSALATSHGAALVA